MRSTDGVAERLAALGIALDEQFAEGRSSTAYRCRWGDGTPAVMKVSTDGEPAIGRRVSAGMWARSVERCERLLDTQSRTVVLQADLHLNNALDGGRLFGWSQVFALLLAMAHLGNNGDETVVEELLTVAR